MAQIELQQVAPEFRRVSQLLKVVTKPLELKLGQLFPGAEYPTRLDRPRGGVDRGPVLRRRVVEPAAPGHAGQGADPSAASPPSGP